MRAVFGLLLVMLGLAMAVVWVPERDGQRQLAVVTDIAVQGLPRIAEIQPGNGRTFSPQMPLLASAEPPGARPQHTVATARVVTPAVEAPHQSTGASIVTGSIATVQQATSAAMPRVQTPDMPRDELVRSLQRELKRVGCYAGEVDGDWGSGSRRAMTNFTDRVNASLPVDQPDFILLTLLKGQPTGTCGRACPSGQAIGDNGRCMPAGIVAQQARRRGREDVAAVQAPGASPGWNTQVVRAQPVQTRDQIEVSTATTASASPSAMAGSAAPLPGRMGMGGPPPLASSAVPAETAARDAIRSAQGDVQELKPGKRDRSRRTARRSGSRYDSPFYVYRASPPPNYYAYAPRRPSRSWTATFFSSGF